MPLTLLFLIGCSLKITGQAVKELPDDIPNETSRNPEVYFCPKEDCSKALENNIKSANSSVHCAFYDINLRNIINILSTKSKAIDVKLVMDNSNYKGQIKGDAVRRNSNHKNSNYKDEQLMQNKFCVIDDKIVATGSFNPTENDNSHNNNNLVVVYSSALAKNYEYEFDELWNGKFGAGEKIAHPILYINSIKIENYFCPEDKCASHIISLIRNAQKSIYFMSFSFTNQDIADALLAKNGLDIRGIFDNMQSSNRFSKFKRLQEFGINAEKSAGRHKMHHKVFIIDNETVATGSFNPTLSADTKNDENLLIIHDKEFANAFLREFDSLWDSS